MKTIAVIALALLGARLVRQAQRILNAEDELRDASSSLRPRYEAQFAR